jgi:tetratricopeptide (TPR) repeat protein/tRNA A-37 threonylcarbamoyl transferase component Bud32
MNNDAATTIMPPSTVPSVIHSRAMDRDEQLLALFEQACALPPDQREHFLSEACAGDPELHARVRALVVADAAAGQDTFWQRSALDHEARETSRMPDPALGATLGAYRLTAVVGAGGMGTVYRGVRVDAAFDQDVAIKRLKRGMDADQIVERFRTERRILASLDHPNIARLFDGGSDEQGLPYFVMEFVEGLTPIDYCAQHALGIRERVALFLPVCDAVHHAHQRMVIHRDVKPGNILITADGTPKLLDFGIAKVMSPDGDTGVSDLTALDGPALTARYASPEQMRGEIVTAATDTYSLGVVLCELLTGESPYAPADDSRAALMRAVCETSPRRPSSITPALRGDLDNILLKAMRKVPGERYESVAHFAEDLRRHLDGRPVLARGDAWSYLARTFVRRHRLAVSAAVLLLLTLIGGIVSTTRAEARADRRFQQVRQLARSVMFDYHDAIAGLPGSTPVRQRLIADALTYLDSLSKEADDPALWAELVDAYVRISNVQGNSYAANLGDTAGALETARKAVSTAVRLLELDDTAASLRSAALAYEAEAGVLISTGNLVTAEDRFSSAVALQARAVELAPRDVIALIEYASILRKMGDLVGGSEMLSLGRTSEGQEWYRRASTVVASALAIAPGQENAERLASTIDVLMAGSDMALGHPAAAADGLRRAVTRIEAAVKAHPHNQTDRQELAGTSLRLAVLLMDALQHAEAVPHIERARTIMSAIAESDPQDTLARRNLAVVETHYANALSGAGKPVEALAHSQASLEIATRLSEADPTSTEFTSDRAVSERKTAVMLLAANRVPEALTLASRALTRLEQIADATNMYVISQVGRARLTRASVFSRMGRPAAAVADLQQAEASAILASQSDPANTVWQSDLGRAQSALGHALREAGRTADARAAFDRALGTWDSLRTRDALTAEDKATADRDAAARTALGRT